MWLPSPKQLWMHNICTDSPAISLSTWAQILWAGCICCTVGKICRYILSSDEPLCRKYDNFKTSSSVSWTFVTLKRHFGDGSFLHFEHISSPSDSPKTFICFVRHWNPTEDGTRLNWISLSEYFYSLYSEKHEWQVIISVGVTEQQSDHTGATFTFLLSFPLIIYYLLYQNIYFTIRIYIIYYSASRPQWE